MARIQRCLLPILLALTQCLAYIHSPETFSDNSSISFPLNHTNSLFRRASEDYTCSADRPCSNKACCGESNVCGYGPTYCGDGCQSHCDAKAECGQYAEVPGTTCPLNVCCSEFGFCGTTADFCGNNCQSNCGSPERPNGGGDVRDRIIGYYESWASSKEPCGAMTPEQIPVDGLTHVNFAFAYIDPHTGDIVPMDNAGDGDEMFSRVTDIKLRKPGIKVWVSIGGWTFNDAGDYQSIFGDIAASTVQSREFAGKLIAFCGKYGFDGVDIDWEYPGADDRGGKKEDKDNFPKMLSIIKSSFGRSPRPLGISITLPTSYWYLRWFDLPELAKSVDWFNLMSYDLHGVWDRGTPIGSYIWPHTNLTEVDEALDLFWRNDISPSIINLGLGFYGRTFKLETPLCSKPGCKFGGPAGRGLCTQEAGILSYREIREIIKEVSIYGGVTYDEEAAVNYFTYGRNQGNSWVSFDDKRSFQAKIDFANKRGLAGLFIWAIDQDDDNLDALRAVTGKDLEMSPALSDVEDRFDISKCYITECGGKCESDETTMVHTNLDESNKGCSGSKHDQRVFCCPALTAPDPKTCNWRGSGPFCRDGHCKEDTEVTMLIDDYGGASGCYFGGRKSWCCPTTVGQEQIKQCKFDVTGKCSDASRPQNLTTVTFGIPAGGGAGGPGVIIKKVEPLCCPEKPEFENCAWHGKDGACDGNRCPVGQVMVASTSASHGGPGDGKNGCSLGRKAVFCCDPPADGSEFLPVALENLFPDADTFDDSWTPIFDEAIGYSPYQKPHHDPVKQDPNEESFAWIVIVGDEEDVQTFDKRDGSHLELYNCPNPDGDDYSVQRLNAVCMNHGESSNCEDITKGGVKGTIVRLPDGCGPDKYVRAVSFKETDNTTSMPQELRKRSTGEPHGKVYEFRYDYNFKNLRRAAGTVHFRADVSNHPGYWDEIVAADNDSPVKKRNQHNWREMDKRWVKENEPDSWRKRFLQLLTRKDVGTLKEYSFKQNLYRTTRVCSDNLAAWLTMDAEGDLTTTMDFGQTIVGTLNNFQFAQAFAFMRQSDFKVHITAGLSAEARARMQTPLTSLDGSSLSTFGSNYNIKGILKINPYLDVRAQIQAEAIVSLQGVVDVTVATPMFHYMFPEELETVPTTPISGWNILTRHSNLNSPGKLSVDVGGAVTISVVPVLGITTEIDYGKRSSITKVEAAFRGDVKFKMSATVGTDCKGFRIGVDAGFAGKLNVSGAAVFPKWLDGSYDLVNKYGTVLDDVCIPYGGGISPGKRGIEMASSTGLELDMDSSSTPHFVSTELQRRAFLADEGAGSVFPDPNGENIYCPRSNGGQGKCRGRHTFVDELENPDDYALRKRGVLVKRDGNKYFCGTDGVPGLNGPKEMKLILPTHMGTTPWLHTWPKVPTFAPKNPDSCDFEFGQIDTPTPDEVTRVEGTNQASLQVEHILETQTFKHFGNHLAEKFSNCDRFRQNPTRKLYDDPRGKVDDNGDPVQISWCEYWAIWWDKMDAKSAEKANTLLGSVLPGAKNWGWSELVLVDFYVNQLKAQAFSPGTAFSDQGNLKDWQKDPPDDSEMPDPISYPDGATEEEKIEIEKEWKKEEKKRPHHWGDILDFVREIIMLYKYMSEPSIQQRLVRSACRYAHRLDWINKTYINQKIRHLQVRGKDYVTMDYNLDLNKPLSDFWWEWLVDTHFQDAENKAKNVITEWTLKVWKENRDPDLFPDRSQLPDGHSFGNNREIIDRAQETYDEVNSMSTWNIGWINSADCDGTYQDPPNVDDWYDTWPAAFQKPIGSD
ncbi:Killer toxin subunits alpha/beta [Lasiodiplodia theobromae]|uniref:chitinase n=1 Tax=Lasiodiplodia theobromae TaxID=45133 RepID=A0A5N5CZ86_9PEZI|nr:Killer toxin subunits alpha/beta [Lasiodiplodia theobromae]